MFEPQEGTPYKRYWWMSFGMLCGLGATGQILLISSPRRSRPIELQLASGSGPVQVYLSGTFAQPGVYELPQGSRAQAISEYRDGNAPIQCIKDIQNLFGIGPNTFGNIQDLIVVEG